MIPQGRRQDDLEEGIGRQVRCSRASTPSRHDGSTTSSPSSRTWKSRRGQGPMAPSRHDVERRARHQPRRVPRPRGGSPDHPDSTVRSTALAVAGRRAPRDGDDWAGATVSTPSRSPSGSSSRVTSPRAKRGRARLLAARSEIAVGKIAGAVGTYRAPRAHMKALALEKLGLSAETVSTQVVARDWHAASSWARWPHRRGHRALRDRTSATRSGPRWPRPKRGSRAGKKGRARCLTSATPS